MNADDETRTFFTVQKRMVVGTRRLLCHSLKPVSTISFSTRLRPLVSCQPHQADEEELSGPSTETSSLLSGPGDIVDSDDAASKKSSHSHCVDVTGLALLYKPDFWQLWVLMGLLTGVGLMTIK